MFSWVASAYLTRQAGRAEIDALMARLRPSLAILSDGRRATGAAALVDVRQGLYLAHGDAVQGDTVQAMVGDWRVSLRVLGQDERTGLVILALRSDAPPGNAPAIALADADPAPGSRILMVLSDGGFAGTFIGGQQFGVLQKKVAVPVSELRFENPPRLVGGALVMTFEGKLLGAMGATVTRPGHSSAVTLRALEDVKKALPNMRSGLGSGFAASPFFGPAPLTVAYTPTLSLVRRSVGGLLADNHRPDYAALGIQVAEAPGGGAAIRQVVPDSPAARSGVQVGDVLLAIGGRPVNKQYDFVQVLLGFHPGDATTLRIRHDGAEKTLSVMLARSR